MPKLTIAIPTFNRNAFLARTVGALLPQLTEDCALVVLDNHSPIPAAETLGNLFAEYPMANCTVLRHAANIGGNANILRCFEVCETPWLWILGDDDTLLPDAIATILRTISAEPDLVYVNYASDIHPRTASFVTSGVAEFARRIDSFGNAMFISSCIFNRPALIDQLHYGFNYTYSCAGHLLVVILALKTDGKCLFSSERLVEWQEPAAEQQYSIVAPSIGRMTMLELPLNPDVRKSLAHAIRHTSYSMRAFARELFYTGVASGDFERSRFLYDQLAYRLYYFDRSLATRVGIRVFRLPLMLPKLFALLNIWSARLTGRKLHRHWIMTPEK